MELFPYSDSSIWSAFKNAQEERENNINNNSNQNNIEKENTGFKINTQEGNTSEDSQKIKKQKILNLMEMSLIKPMKKLIMEILVMSQK